MTLAVDAERGHDGDDAAREERLQEAHVDPLDLAREEVVDSAQDAEGVRDHRVRGRAAQVGGGEALQDLVGQAVGGGEGQLQGGGVRDARALEVGGRDTALVGEGLDLVGRPVDEHRADAEGPQHRHVHQDVDEVLVGDGGPVHRHHERLLPELGDVLEHAPEVGRSHAGNVILVALPWKKTRPTRSGQPPDPRGQDPSGSMPPATSGEKPSTASASAGGRSRSTTRSSRPPKALVLEKVRSGIAALVTTLRDPIDEEVFAAGKTAGLRVVSQIAVGVDNIDRAAANRHRIPFTHTPDVLTDATAEYAFFMMGAVARKLYPAEVQVRAREWTTWHPYLPWLGDEVTGRTIAVLGMGRIGQSMANKAVGFDMDVLCHSTSRSAALSGFVASCGG